MDSTFISELNSFMEEVTFSLGGKVLTQELLDETANKVRDDIRNLYLKYGFTPPVIDGTYLRNFIEILLDMGIAKVYRPMNLSDNYNTDSDNSDSDNDDAHADYKITDDDIQRIRALSNTTDATKWADVFVYLAKRIPTMALSKDAMVEWFGNALTVGSNNGRKTLMDEIESANDRRTAEKNKNEYVYVEYYHTYLDGEGIDAKFLFDSVDDAKRFVELNSNNDFIPAKQYRIFKMEAVTRFEKREIK